MTLVRWLTFSLQSLTVTLSPDLLDSFLSSDASICSTKVFPPLGSSDHVIISVSIDFPSNLKADTLFITQLMAIFVLICTVFLILCELIHQRMFLYLVLWPLVLNFVSGSRLQYIPTVDIRSSNSF